MKKVNWQQAERKLDERIKGGVSLWDRITADPEFIKIKHEIQARYDLPLNYDIRLNNRKWIKWLGYDQKPTSQKAKRGQAFLSDVHTLFRKFEVPEGWYDDLIGEIAGHSLEVWSSPKFEIYKDNEGNWKWQCIITPETDLTNPMNLDLIREQQKAWAGDPPKPAKDKNNLRKLDWRPVYEWYKRHPLFTLEEIAQKIGYPAHRVRLKLAELETKE
jgi:hypothetical protein